MVPFVHPHFASCTPQHSPQEPPSLSLLPRLHLDWIACLHLLILQALHLHLLSLRLHLHLQLHQSSATKIKQ